MKSSDVQVTNVLDVLSTLTYFADKGLIIGS